MMGKTHYAVGMATALAVIQPKDIKECMVTLAAGAIGGVFADIDTVNNDYKHDALIGQLLAYGTLALVLLVDYFMRVGILESIKREAPIRMIIGVTMYIVILAIGFFTNHRTFTHSLLSLILSSIAVTLIYVPFAIAYVMGYLSHLILDILNKKKVPLMYPKGDGICLGWCYAGKTANTVFVILGFIATPIIIVMSLVK